MELRSNAKSGWRSAWLPDSPLYLGILLMTVKVELAMNDLFAVSSLVDNAITAAGMLIFLYYALRGWPDWKGMLLCGIGLCIIGVAAVRIRNFHLLITAMTVLALRNGDIKKAIRLIFSWKCLFFVAYILLSLVVHYKTGRPLGRIDNARFRFFIPSRFRFWFGYRSTTAPGDMLFALVLMWCYLHFGSIRKRDAAVIVGLSTVCYMLCVSRMPYLLTLGTLAVVMFYQHRENAPVLNAIAKWIVPALSVLFIGILLQYPNWPNFIWQLDEVLTHRMIREAGWYAYRGITLLGKSTQGIYISDPTGRGLDMTILDCLYQNMAIWMGILPLVVICVCFYLLAKRKNTADNLMICIWAVYSICEVSGLNCYLQFVLILTAAALPNIQGEGKTEWLPFPQKSKRAKTE